MLAPTLWAISCCPPVVARSEHSNSRLVICMLMSGSWLLDMLAFSKLIFIDRRYVLQEGCQGFACSTA